MKIVLFVFGYYNFINNKLLFVIKSNNAKKMDYVIKYY